MVESGKYAIAWFKLAEFVGRKEKERALAMGKLLAHSLHDEALALQLQGDIFFAFEDRKGEESYIRAAVLYEKQQKKAPAAFIYDHLSTLLPQTMFYKIKALILYAQLSYTEQFLKIADMSIKAAIITRIYGDIETCIEELPAYYRILFSQRIVLLHALNNTMHELVYKSIDYIVHHWMDDVPENKRFLTQLSAIHEELYADVVNRFTQL